MAGRTPQPWYWKDRRTWCVILKGRRVNLGRDRAEAIRCFHRLAASDNPGEASARRAPVEVGLTFSDLVGRYLADLRGRVGPRTHYVAACYLNPVVAACGPTPASGVRKAHLCEAVRAHGRWNATTENHVLGRVLAAYNWAVEQELLPANPLKGLKKPRCRSRGADSLVSADDHARLMAAAPPYLRDVLFALQQTGARPCEVLTVAAADFDPGVGVWVLRRHKTDRETDRPRVVFLTTALTDLCRRLAERHPTGPLFRRASGKPFPPAYYLPRLVRSLRRKLGLPETVSPYSYRHSWATDALANGVPDAHVAELLGHTSTAMLHRHYAHLGAKARVLREALSAVR
jgi:integrase